MTCGALTTWAADGRLHIFDYRESVLRVSFDGGDIGFVLDRQDARTIPFGAVTRVSVELSHDWSERGINLQLGPNDEPVRVVTDDGSYLLDKLEASPELTVMIMTEWMVKAAGALVMQMRKCGYQVPLVLPKILTAEGNSMVHKRNQQWKRQAMEQYKR